MATYKLPVDQALPWYTFTTTLSGIRYQFEMSFNVRSGRWHMSLYDAGGNPVVLGIPMLTGRALTEQYRTRAVPPGALFVVDSTGKGQAPTLNSFQTTHELLYIEPQSAEL